MKVGYAHRTLGFVVCIRTSVTPDEDPGRGSLNVVWFVMDYSG